jgi:4-hydroxy-tetrahydrodipicolinate synthase
MGTSTNSATWLSGYIPDIPTPFDTTGAIDLAAFHRLCERQVEAGATAIVVCETTGEASTLTPEEQSMLIRAAVEVARGRLRVIAGAGSNSTSQAIELTKHAEAEGADAVLSVVPYYNKPMQSGIAAHFLAIAEATALPMILHDIPARTNRELGDDTLIRLARSHRFIGLLDHSGNTARIARVRPRLPAGFRLLSGDDATAVAYFASGGDGCVSMAANVVPQLCRTFATCCQQERWSSARDLLGRVAALATALSSDSPAALKAALSALGLIRPHLRLPMVELDAARAREIAEAVMAVGERALSTTEA